MFKVISLDFGGVLTCNERVFSNDKRSLLDVILEELSKAKVNIPIKDVRKYLSNPSSSSEDEIINLTKILSDLLAEYRYDPMIANIIMMNIADQRWYKRKISELAIDVIKKLYSLGVKLVLSSDDFRSPLFRRTVLDDAGVLRYFDLTLFGSEYGRKEQGVIFDKILKYFDIQDHQLLHVGDDIQDDIEPTYNLNIPNVYVGRSSYIKNITHITYRLKNIKELPSLVKKLNGLK